jgi:serine/threonine-protein kinase
MSPEQVQSAKDVDARTDLWALGVVLFQLLTGTVPFQGEAFGEIAIKIATQETPSLRGYRPEAPPALDAIIGKCLAKDRKRRYANVAELALALLPFASKRATASVERITGIIRAAGLSASALGMPPSPQTREKTMLAPQTPETGAPWSAPDETRGSGKKAMVGVVAVVVAVLVLVCGMISIRWLSPRGQAANSGSVTTLPPPRPEAALPAAAVTTDETPTPERLVPPPSTPTMPPTAPPLQKQTTTIPSPPPTKHNVSPPPAVATVTIPNAVPKAVPKPDCDPNFTLDDQGRKHWKPECFAK